MKTAQFSSETECFLSKHDQSFIFPPSFEISQIPESLQDEFSHFKLRYSVRQPWAWVFESAFHIAPSSTGQLYTSQYVSLKKHCTCTNSSSSSPTSISSPSSHPAISSPSSLAFSQSFRTATARFELLISPSSSSSSPSSSSSSSLIRAFWCSSPCFDALRNKDLLVSSLTRHGLSWAAPPSLLLPSSPELLADPSCLQSLALPPLLPLPSPLLPWRAAIGHRSFLGGRFVLKPPMGCQGEGIAFLGSVEECLPLLEEDARRVAEHGTDLWVGRTPRWVLQAHIASFLVGDDRKMHLRTHLVLIEDELSAAPSAPPALSSPPRFRLYFHRRHEVRMAGRAALEAQPDDRSAQITNGAGGSSTFRCLLQDVEALKGLEETLEQWLQKFLGDMTTLLSEEIAAEGCPPLDLCGSVRIRRWAFAALDIMVDESGRLWLLEVNRVPGAPAFDLLDENPPFRDHLTQMAQDIFQLVVFQNPTNQFTEIIRN